MQQILSINSDAPSSRGTVQQKGAGAYTLCEQCNNNTGSWYGTHFVDWCYQGMEILRSARGAPSLIHLNYVFPLSVIKQIATMFFSLHDEKFRLANPELERFVLRREAKYLPPKYRCFVYYNTEGQRRYNSTSAILHLSHGARELSEFSYPPYGYVMTYGDDPPHDRMFEITHFSRYDYREFTIMSLRLPVLATYGPMPGDYRPRSEVYPGK